MHHEKEAEPDGSSTHHRKDEADVAPAVVHGRVHFGLLHGFQAAGRARATLAKAVRLQLESLQAHLATQALVADGAATIQAARAAARGGVAEVPLVASLGADLGLWVKEARVFRTIWSAHEEPVLAKLLPVRRLDHEVNQPLVPHIHWNDDCCRRPLHLSDRWQVLGRGKRGRLQPSGSRMSATLAMLTRQTAAHAGVHRALLGGIDPHGLAIVSALVGELGVVLLSCQVHGVHAAAAVPIGQQKGALDMHPIQSGLIAGQPADVQGIGHGHT
mmetsp:Transcript_150044/g.482250  ORF Transcript_150044/g.482250 Transcript_150044/m.482250 type:complete len:273 (-) Transcript_150044:425-1243(-)